MSRRDFESIAKMLREQKAEIARYFDDEQNRAAAEIMRRKMALELASICSEHNPRFNRARFLSASEVD